MTALVTAHMALLADAPGGIPALRQLIRELAISGRLVPQVQVEKPAISVLDRVTEMRAGVATNKSGRPSLAEDADRRLKRPSGWVDTSVAEVTVCRDGDRIPVAQVDRDRRAKIYDYYGASGVIDKIDGFLFDKPLLLVGEDGANLINRSTPIAFLARGKYWVNNHAHVLDSCSETVLRYLALYFNAIDLKPYVTGTAQPKLNQAKLNSIPVALPPEAEQHRIVAKVDELMALCDRLEARQQDAEAAHAQLVQVLLDSLTQARNADDFKTSWRRLEEQFQTVFISEGSVDALRQALIDCGTAGRFSDGWDGASMPDSWRHGNLGELVLESGAGWSPTCEARPRVGDEWGVLKVSAVSWGAFQHDENKALPAHLAARPEFEVRPGDFLISRANTAQLVARSVVVEDTPPKLMLSDKIVRLKLSETCDVNYVQLVNSSTAAREYYAAVAGGTSSSMKNVSRPQILALPVLLPPICEQRRIVAKVNEFMALCDQLKSRIAAARAKQAQLAEALIAQAVAA